MPVEDEENIQQEEILALENEFRWVLTNEVHNVLKELSSTLRDCVVKFPVTICGIDKALETEKFVLSCPPTSPPDQIKVVVAMVGESITQADINLKLPRPGGKDLYQNSLIREDAPWRLNQIQDAANHLQIAMDVLASIEKDRKFKNAAEVDSFLGRIISSLQRCRSSLVTPKKKTLDELHNSKQMRSLQPPLPSELALSFYLQGFKLILAVYHVVNDKNVSRFVRYQSECTIPWINDVLLLLTVSMQLAQQLRDKVNVFAQYPDVEFQLSEVTSEAK